MDKETVVCLVGAGPGRRELITLAGLEWLRRADWLLYDQLLDPALLEEVPEKCRRIYVGKQAGRHAMKQEEINQLLLDCAARGGVVVRLKGGDPYVFGRGGEEALCLRRAGVPFRVVPGVPSPIGGLAWAGIPVTHRGLAGGVHIVTAHTREGLPGERYQALAALEGTLVFLMGLERVEEICRGLWAGGMDPATPAAVVSRAARWDQQVLAARLDTLPALAARAALPSPAMVVVGRVVELGEELSFARELPLWGERVLIARTSDRSGKLARLLEEAGAQTLQAPLLRLEEAEGALDGALEEIGSFDHILFTSGHTVELFVDRLLQSGRDLRSLARASIWAVGESTAKRLKERGLLCDGVAQPPRAEGLLAALLPRLTPDSRVLLPQSGGARPLLREGLEGRCRLTAVELYRPVPEEGAGEELRRELEEGGFTALVFSSGAGADQFARTVGFGPKLPPCYSIGPVTTKALERYGITPVEAQAPTLEGLRDAIAAHRKGGERT